MTAIAATGKRDLVAGLVLIVLGAAAGIEAAPATALTLAVVCTLFAAVVFSGLSQFQMPFVRW